MKIFLYILIGSVAAFVIYKMVVPKQVVSPDQTSKDFTALLQTPETQKLIASEEFAGVLVTPEFLKLMRGVGQEYLKSITKSLLV